MNFIGQKHIIRLLRLQLPLLYSGRSGALLFRGPSGYGKTHLARMVCSFLAGREYSYQLGNSFEINDRFRVHFIDEIHLCKEPEILYPLIDEERYVFVFATNFNSALPEAFQNRCLNLVFTAYTEKDLISIFKKNCKYKVPLDVIKHVIRVSGGNPRIMIKTYIQATINSLFELYEDEMMSLSKEEMIEKIDEIHGIKDGLIPTAIEYISALKKLGGRSSISRLADMLKVDEGTLKEEVEPILIKENLLQISSRGRILC